MKIAFHAPLKSPDHPVPSGDRQMARMLIEALGWQVTTSASPRNCAPSRVKPRMRHFRRCARRPSGRSPGFGGSGSRKARPTCGFATTLTTRLRISSVPRSRRTSPFHTLPPRVLIPFGATWVHGNWRKMRSPPVQGRLRSTSVSPIVTARVSKRRYRKCALRCSPLSSMCRRFATCEEQRPAGTGCSPSR